MELVGIIIAIIVAVVTFVLGFRLQRNRAAVEIKTVRADATRLLEEAESKHRELLLEAKDEALKARTQVENETGTTAELQRQERRIQQKDENLDRKAETIERRERTIQTREKEQEAIRAELENAKKEQVKALERIGQMSIPEARELLLKSIEDEVREDASRRIRVIELEAREEGERRRVISCPGYSALCQRAGCRDNRLRCTLAQRRDEGPYHWP